MGRVIDVGPVRQPGADRDGSVHCAIMIPTTLAPVPADEGDGDLIRGMPVAALTAVSIGGLEMTDRLIISVNILSYITT